MRSCEQMAELNLQSTFNGSRSLFKRHPSPWLGLGLCGTEQATVNIIASYRQCKVYIMTLCAGYRVLYWLPLQELPIQRSPVTMTGVANTKVTC